MHVRGEGEAFPLNKNVAGKPAEPKPPYSRPQQANGRDGETDDDQCAGHCRSAASDY
jgi:hypothetical protein